MPVLMSTSEFTAECAQRRIDYDRLFERRVTPEWLMTFEQQVLDECRADLRDFDDPGWRRIFEMREQAFNKGYDPWRPGFSSQ